MPETLILVRHGETEWSATGRHTGRTDVPLTATGRGQADRLGALFGAQTFTLVLTSPLARARETCERAGFAAAEVRDELVEWDYGDYEGRRTTEIRQEIPGWSVWTHPIIGGESAQEVGTRADRLLEELAGVEGRVALFAHGHLLRILTARWLGFPAYAGRCFALATATWSELGWERETRVIRRWNQACPADAGAG